MKIFDNFLQIDIAPGRRSLSEILYSKYWTMIFISINTAVCKNFEPPTYMNIYWRDLLIWWGVIYPSANIVFFWHKNACMMMQLQACVNFSCLKTFCTKNEHIYIYLYISLGFKIFANIYIIYMRKNFEPPRNIWIYLYMFMLRYIQGVAKVRSDFFFA